MSDIKNLLNELGAEDVHYKKFHEDTPEGHTQQTRHSAPLVETEAKSDTDTPLYDPDAAQYESHPLPEGAVPDLSKPSDDAE
jgi:hypothetical protein